MFVIGMLFDLFEVTSHRILGHFLNVDVDCGVNAVAFVDCTIPSHGCDYLLADVINRVSLSLSVLPASDLDLLCSRGVDTIRASMAKAPPGKALGKGLGALINISRGLFDTPLMFAALITLAVLTLTFYLIAVLLERALVRWEQ